MVENGSGQRPGRNARHRGRQRAIVAFALLGPLVAAGALHLAGDHVTAAVGALVLTLVVVGAAASGLRTAGVLAAVSASAWFDFFLTEPRWSFTVFDRDGVEITVLLLVVGLVVTEVALWGRRQQDRASRRAGYLDGVLSTADLVALPDTSPDMLVARVAERITDLLGVDDCRFEGADRRARSTTLMHRDGAVTQCGNRVDVDRHGLPTDDLIVLPVERAGTEQGRFVLTSSTQHVRPTTEQRRIAVTLADQVGARLALGVPASRQVRVPGR